MFCLLVLKQSVDDRLIFLCDTQLCKTEHPFFYEKYVVKYIKKVILGKSQRQGNHGWNSWRRLLWHCSVKLYCLSFGYLLSLQLIFLWARTESNILNFLCFQFCKWHISNDRWNSDKGPLAKKYSFVPVVGGLFVGVGWVSAGGVVGVGWVTTVGRVFGCGVGIRSVNKLKRLHWNMIMKAATLQITPSGK